MNLLYYYYFLFYTEIIPEDDPHTITMLTLSLSESFLVIGILEILSVHLACDPFNVWIKLAIYFTIYLINYYYYSKSGKCKEIVISKPILFKSKNKSILIVALFFISTASFFMWEPLYIKQLLEHHCK